MIGRHAGTSPNKTKTKDTINLKHDSLCCTASRNGWESIRGSTGLSIDDDVDAILEDCPIT